MSQERLAPLMIDHQRAPLKRKKLSNKYHHHIIIILMLHLSLKSLLLREKSRQERSRKRKPKRSKPFLEPLLSLSKNLQPHLMPLLEDHLELKPNLKNQLKKRKSSLEMKNLTLLTYLLPNWRLYLRAPSLRKRKPRKCLREKIGMFLMLFLQLRRIIHSTPNSLALISSKKLPLLNEKMS